MRKSNILIILILVIAFFFIMFFIFLIQEPEQGYLTDIEKLYSLFTPYMESWVDSHLEKINCKPNEFYIASKEICFNCNKFEACFGYASVRRTGGMKMNPKGKPYLKNVKEISLEVADFYKEGLASKFDCQKKNKNILECDEGVSFVKNDSEFDMILRDQNEIEKIAQTICSHFNKEFSGCLKLEESTSCFCGERTLISFLNDGKITW